MVKPSDIAEIRIWGQSVGAVYWDRTRNLGFFEYTPEFIRQGIELSPLHLPLRSGVFSFPAINRDTYKGLPAFLSDTLPDDFGNAVINSWLARNGRVPNDFSPVERLLYTGTRGMGALEFYPQLESSLEHSEGIELESLIQMAQSILSQRQNYNEFASSESWDDKALSKLLQVGTSAGGARPKALVALNQDKSEIRSGQIQHSDDFDYWLLKFDGIVEHSQNSELFGDPQGFGAMEYAYYCMAIDADIQMTPCELLRENNRAHFITKRFDRTGKNVIQKIHSQTLCAMAHADYKKPGSFSYEETLGVMRQLRLSRLDAVELYRRMVFNVIARNQDDHTKNISFLMDKKGQWRLAPAYDIAWAYKENSPWVHSHQMSINGKRDHFEREDLLAVAQQIGGFSRLDANRIIEHTLAVVSEWKFYAKEAGVFAPLIEEIQGSLRLGI